MWSTVLAVGLVCVALAPRSGAHVLGRRQLAGGREDADFWTKLGAEDLQRALKEQHVQLGVATNIILFLGDGLSIPTITAARIYQGQQQGRRGEEGFLAFEMFPHVSLIKPYSVNKQVPDSASTATAIFSGVKANYKTVGLDANAVYTDCDASLGAKKLDTIVKWAQDAGKSTGFVTTARVTHATPAALYGHAASRYWECDGNMTEAEQKCVDLGTQLVREEPGRSIQVILGGGRQCLMTNPPQSAADPLDDWGCQRQDGRDLVAEWRRDKEARRAAARYVTNTRELGSVDVPNTDYLLGIFYNDHFPYEDMRDTSEEGGPHISLMTKKAIEMLQKNKKGYFLMVEGAKIDLAHHKGWARRALTETLAFDEAVRVAMEMTDSRDTLIIVTSDHAHTMSISGYPVRGNPILGTAGTSDTDDLPYTTLMYGAGPGYNYTADGSEALRWNITGTDLTGVEYRQLAAVPMSSGTHGGDDISLYSVGPMAHLFYGVHEQNYIAHAMSYAACVGPHRDICPNKGGSSSAGDRHVCRLLLLLSVLVTAR